MIGYFLLSAALMLLGAYWGYLFGLYRAAARIVMDGFLFGKAVEARIAYLKAMGVNLDEKGIEEAGDSRR